MIQGIDPTAMMRPNVYRKIMLHCIARHGVDTPIAILVHAHSDRRKSFGRVHACLR